MKESAGAGFTTATDIADWLVRAANVPFRQAHHITGQIVRLAETRSVGLDQLALSDFQAIDQRITAEVFSVLGVEDSAASRTSFGGTAPANVIAAVQTARQRFL
jgi:argininosuccinate lyase